MNKLNYYWIRFKRKCIVFFNYSLDDDVKYSQILIRDAKRYHRLKEIRQHKSIFDLSDMD